MNEVNTSLEVGARLGRYEIVAPLGGGMSEVYRATDTRLQRTVAIKVLPRELADRADRRERLEREARATSALSHPHICALYDVGEHDGAVFLVMEYVAGETLASRLERGPLSLTASLDYAIQIADALDHAHRQGFVHRDLKPANIMLSPIGVKLLDFGLVKLREADAAASTGSAPVPDTESLTTDGAILGTFPYMAPEQVEAREADARSDIFSFGAVLYEMVSGCRAFRGDTRAGLIVSILERQPASLAVEVRARGPANRDDRSLGLVEHVVTRCLAKQPDDRWQTSADLKRELEWIAHGDAAHDRTSNRGGLGRGRAPVLLAAGAVALIAVTVTAVLISLRASTSADVVRFSVAPEAGTKLVSGPAAPQFAVSPDGKWLAFTAGPPGQSALWMRALQDITARPLPGTDGARYPFWSPDSQQIGFFALGSLKIVRPGETPVTLCAAPEPEGGAWSRAGVIVFAPIQRGELMRVPVSGGPVVAATHSEPGRVDRKHSWPWFLPDGRRFLYWVSSERPEQSGIYLQSLDGGSATFLLHAGSRAVSASGYLLFGRDDTLMAQPFDETHAKLSGTAVPIARGVATNPDGRMPFSVSATDTLIYRGGLGGMPPSTLRWFDRSGAPLGNVGDTAQYGPLLASPDGKTMVAGILERPSGAPMPRLGLWLFDLVRGSAREVVEQASVANAVWSPDGESIAYTINAYRDLVRRRADGAGGIMPVLKSGEDKFPSSWSPDGQVIVYSVLDPATGWDIWTVPVAGDHPPHPYLRTTFNEGEAQFSPDGRWLAYMSTESGTREVWVQDYPASGAKFRISANGGYHPLWRPDGRELYYLDASNRLVAHDVAGGVTLQLGPPHVLFQGRLNQGLSEMFVNQFVASPDGQRFLFKVDQAEDPPMTVVLNWRASLPRR